MKLLLVTESSALSIPHVLATLRSTERTVTRVSSAIALTTMVITLYTFLRKERKMKIPKWLRRKTSVEFARHALDAARREHLEAQIGEEFARAMVSYRARVVILTTKFLEKMEDKVK